PHISFTEGDLILAQAKNPPWRPNFNGAELRLIRAKIGRQKIEDVVLARINAGLERRPRDRRNGRQRAAERLEAALVTQLGQMGQLAFGEQSLRQAVIQAIQPEDYHPFDAAARRGASLKQHAPQQAERPSQQQRDGRTDRQEHGQKRPGEGEPRARSDISVRWARSKQHQENRQEQQPTDLAHYAYFFSGSFVCGPLACGSFFSGSFFSISSMVLPGVKSLPARPGWLAAKRYTRKVGPPPGGRV